MVPELVEELPKIEDGSVISEENNSHEEQKREQISRYLLEKQSSHGSLVSIIDEKRRARDQAYEELKAIQPSYEKTARNVLLGVLRKQGIDDPDGFVTALEKNDPEAFTPGKKAYQELRNLKIFNDDGKIDFATGLRRMSDLGIRFKTSYLSDFNFANRVRDFANISEEDMNRVIQAFDTCDFLYRDVSLESNKPPRGYLQVSPFFSPEVASTLIQPPERGSHEYFSYMGGWLALLSESDKEKLQETAALSRRLWDFTDGKCFFDGGDYAGEYYSRPIERMRHVFNNTKQWRQREELLEQIYSQNPEQFEEMLRSDSFAGNFFNSFSIRDLNKAIEIFSQTVLSSNPQKKEYMLGIFTQELTGTKKEDGRLYQSIFNYLNENEGIPPEVKDEQVYNMFSNEITRVDTYKDMAILLEIGAQEQVSDSLRHVILSKIVAMIQVNKLSERADIETLQRKVSEILKSKVYVEMPDNIDTFLFRYIIGQLPIGLTGDVIGQVRDTGLDLAQQGAELGTEENRYPLEWAHQALHNYPTPQNVALFRTFDEFIHASTPEDREAAGSALESIAASLNPLARPNIKQLLAMDPEKLRVATESLVKKAKDGLQELYTPSFTLLSEQLANIREHLPGDSYDIVTHALGDIEAAKDEPVSAVDTYHQLMQARKIIKDALPQLPGDIIPIVCAADRALDMAGYSIIPKALAQLRSRFQEEPFDRQAAVEAIRLETSMAQMLKVVGVDLSEEGDAIAALKQLAGDIEDPYLPLDVMMQRLEAAAQRDKLAYEKGWMSATEQFIPAVVQELIAKQIRESGKSRDNISQTEYEAFYRHAIDEARGNTSNIIERTSTLFPIRLGLEELREIVGIKNREQTHVSKEEATQRVKNEIQEIITQGKQDVLETYEQATTTGSLPEDVAEFINKQFEKRENVDPLSSEFTNDLTTIAQSSYARAYRLLQLMEGKNGELDEEALREKGYYITEINGVPLLIIKKGEKFSRDPYKTLTKLYQPVQAAVNFTRHEGD